MMCDKSQALSILAEVYQGARNAFGEKLVDAYLYGSYARGDYHDESDVDILLTVDAEPDELPMYRKAVSPIRGQLSLEHDVLVSISIVPQLQFKRFERVLPYYENIVKEGIRYAS